MYHSHYDEVRDAQTGLMGAIVIYEPRTLMSNGLPKNVDKEFFSMFMNFDENDSLLNE
jgi:hypothetical protein